MKEIRVGTPVTVDGFTIVPLEEVSILHESSEKGLRAYASKKPMGIVVSSARGSWALDVCGEEVELEAYLQEIPGLREFFDKSQA